MVENNVDNVGRSHISVNITCTWYFGIPYKEILWIKPLKQYVLILEDLTYFQNGHRRKQDDRHLTFAKISL